MRCASTIIFVVFAILCAVTSYAGKSWSPPKLRPVELAALANRSIAANKTKEAERPVAGNDPMSPDAKVRWSPDVTKGHLSKRASVPGAVGGAPGGAARIGSSPRANPVPANAGRSKNPRTTTRKSPLNANPASKGNRPIRLPSRSVGSGNIRGIDLV